jgi:hypothetical protein
MHSFYSWIEKLPSQKSKIVGGGLWFMVWEIVDCRKNIEKNILMFIKQAFPNPVAAD